jgi:hypothetical protein
MSYISFGKGLKAKQLAENLKENGLLNKPITVTFKDREHALVIEYDDKDVNRNGSKNEN